MILNHLFLFSPGLAYGISLGYREITFDATLGGSIGLIMGLNVIIFVPIVYLNYYLYAETSTYKALNFQGSPNALALMILIWTIFVTMLHENEENALTNAVIQTAVKFANGEEDDVVIADENAPIAEESEF
jgi:hypothetical protein